jgi:hypothetical protein
LLIEPFSRRYHFTPRLYGYDTVLGETRIRCKQTFAFADVEGPNIRWLNLSLISGFQKWELLDGKGQRIGEGELRKGEVAVREGKIPHRGCIVFSPGTAGGIAIYPLQGELIFRIEGNNAVFGQKVEGTAMEGQVFANRILLVRLPIEGDQLTLARDFGAAFGLFEDIHTKKWEAKLIFGALASAPYPLILKAVDGGVLFKFEDKDLPSGLPVFVDGLNDHWDAVIWREGEREFLPLGVRDGRGYFQLSQERNDTGTFYLGHIVTCDNKEVYLHIEPLAEKGLRIVAHNPTAKVITTTLRRAKGLNWLPYFEQKIAIKPGEDVEVIVKR